MKRPDKILCRDTVGSPTDPCPFCGKRHVHGIPDGWRVPHCLNYEGSEQYFIKTRT